MPAEKAARRVLKRRFKAVQRLLPVASRHGRDDPEHIHRLRVATRRAGASLRVFGDLAKGGAVSRARRMLKRIRRSAGGARDCDVHGRMFAELRQRAEGDRSAAIDFLIERLRGERESAQRRVEETADRYPKKRMRRVRRALLRAVGDRAEDVGGATLREAAADKLAALIERVREAAALDLQDMENVHALRIEGKRLRYALEIFAPCFNPDTHRRLYERLVQTQDRLGEVTDVDAVIDRLSRVVEEMRSESASPILLRGVESLLERYRELLLRRHHAFLSEWDSLGAQGVLEQLRCAIAPSQGADHPPRAEDARSTPADLGQNPANPDDGAAAATNGAPKRTAPGTGTQRSDRTRLAAIDVGTNSTRLVVVETRPEGGYRVLDDEKETTRLGQGLDTTGQLSPEAVEHTIVTIARMKGIAEGYNAEAIRVIGTAAVREASNGEDFVLALRDRVGVELEIISADEEARLSFLSASRAFDLGSVNAAVVDIGGGSAEVVLSCSGVVDRVYTVPLGAVRLTDRFGGPEAAATRRYKQMRSAIKEEIESRVGRIPFSPQIFIGTGGTFTTLGAISIRRELGPAAGGLFAMGVQGHEMKRSEVRHLLDYLREMPLRQRVRVPGLSADRAEIIVAGAALAECLMRKLDTNRLRVHEGGIRHGLILDMIERRGGPSADDQPESADPMRAVRRFARACGYEHRHSRHVAMLSLQIFDRLAHTLGHERDDRFSGRERTLLEAAAILHDVGYLINYAAHHKHSYHMILNADLSGLSARETAVVANVARYHRRTTPKKKHRNFARLAEGDRELVRRLAGILRVADGLDRTHMQSVAGVDVHICPDEALFRVLAPEEPSVDIWGARRKSALFEKVFGLSPRFEWVRCDADDSAQGEARRDASQPGEAQTPLPAT